MFNRLLIKKRRDVAEGIAVRLHEAEHAYDEAIAKAAALLGALPVARRESQMAAEAGQEAFAQVAASITALIVARGQMVASHSSLAATAKDYRLDPTAFGPLEEKSQAQAPLVAVAA